MQLLKTFAQPQALWMIRKQIHCHTAKQMLHLSDRIDAHWRQKHYNRDFKRKSFSGTAIWTLDLLRPMSWLISLRQLRLSLTTLQVGRHSTEVAFALPSQPSRVQIFWLLVKKSNPSFSEKLSEPSLLVSRFQSACASETYVKPMVSSPWGIRFNRLKAMAQPIAFVALFSIETIHSFLANKR